MIEKILKELEEKGDIEDLFTIDLIESLLETYSEDYILDNWNTLIREPTLDEFKQYGIKKLRKITTDYINDFVPDYRQINFTSAKVNTLYILTYSTDQIVKDNTKAILLKIRDLEKWITSVIQMFYQFVDNITNATSEDEVRQIVNNATSQYDTIPKPQKLESKDIAYIEEQWFNLQL